MGNTSQVNNNRQQQVSDSYATKPDIQKVQGALGPAQCHQPWYNPGPETSPAELQRAPAQQHNPRGSSGNSYTEASLRPGICCSWISLSAEGESELGETEHGGLSQQTESLWDETRPVFSSPTLSHRKPQELGRGTRRGAGGPARRPDRGCRRGLPEGRLKTLICELGESGSCLA